ncbi:type IV pilus modification protein PilV [Pseudomonas sp. M30-35]|uniref:type IV pilus modification protein PilV n=1 Tax=Pseudomonas sp. M30-35 TaxID=1981174 RepID=UPI000B3D2FDF|nr:type IV pilus modification protein PilV [Pseudomonas sp. M30-35]ARU89807.1 type IV pilus modification protein PilV [Pseudomonas sp. M30-35]
MTTADMRRFQNGTSLIEALVTLLIFTVGLLGFAALQLSALQSSSDSGFRTQATWVVQELAERMRANPDADVADYTAAVDCAKLPPQRCSDYFDPLTGAKVNASNCSAAQMAAFDRWEAQCAYGTAYTGNANAADARYTSRDFLGPAAAGLTPLDISATGNVFTITANWQSRSTNTSGATPENMSGTVQVER